MSKVGTHLRFVVTTTLSFSIFAFFSWTFADGRGLGFDETTIKKGKVYQQGSNKSFSGSLYSRYSDGKVSARTDYKDGVRDGKSIQYNQKGQPLSVEHFRQGKDYNPHQNQTVSFEDRSQAYLKYKKNMMKNQGTWILVFVSIVSSVALIFYVSNRLQKR